MVVLALSVLGNHPAAGRRGGRPPLVVVEPAGHHGPFWQCGRIVPVANPCPRGVAPAAGIRGHPVHGPVVSIVQPLFELPAGFGHPGRGESDRGEPEPESLFPDRIPQLYPLSPVVGHGDSLPEPAREISHQGCRIASATCWRPAGPVSATCPPGGMECRLLGAAALTSADDSVLGTGFALPRDAGRRPALQAVPAPSCDWRYAY